MLVTETENRAVTHFSVAGWLSRWGWLVSGGIVLAGFLPILSVFLRQQWQRPEYQAFPLLIGFAVFIFATRLRAANPVDRSSWWMTSLAWISVLLAIFLLAVSFSVFSPWLAMIAFVVYAFGVTCFVWQNWELEGLWGIWLLLVLLIPPPLDRDQMFIEFLQLFSSQFTSSMLDFLGVLHVMQGNVLSFPDRQLFVDEACSGIVSLISIVYCIAIYCVWERKRLLQSVLLIAAGVGLTILMNSMRLLTIATAWVWFRVDLTAGLPHAILGLVVFVLTLVILFVLDRLLRSILAPIDLQWRVEDQESHPGLFLMKIWNGLFATPDQETDPDEIEVDPPVPSGEVSASIDRMTRFTSPLGLPVAVCFGVMGILYLVYFGVQESTVRNAVGRAVSNALAMKRELHPGDLPGMTLTDFSTERRELFRWDNWGQYSRTWFYRDEEGIEYNVSCDFLFGPNWHDLRVCYRGSGWEIASNDIVPFEELGNPNRGNYEIGRSLEDTRLLEQFVIRQKNQSLQGLVTYGAFRATGEWFNKPRGAGLFGDFWAHLIQGRDRAEQADYFQVQVSTNYLGELPERQKVRAENLLKVAIGKFYRELAAGSAPGND